jgi:hypothetical protein
MHMPGTRFVFFLLALILPVGVSAQEWQWSVAVGGGKSNPDARAWLWIPASCKSVRAVIVAQNNMEELSILENDSFRLSMSKLGIAEVWVSPPFDHNFRWTEGAGEVFDHLMKDLADSSGYSELRLSPVIAMGHSAAASWPYYFAAWAPERTLACLSVSGQWPYFRHPQYAPDIWAKDQNIDYIPSLETMGEYEAAATWSAEGLRERQAHPAMPLSMLACPAEGHFAATQKKIDYLAFYIGKAMTYRLPGRAAAGSGGLKMAPRLKKIDPLHMGWLMDKWRYDQPPAAPPAPVGKYTGDPAEAFWFFDEETMRATAEYEAAYRRQRAPLLGYEQDGKMVWQRNTHLQEELRWLPQADGISFILNAHFLDTVPGESPRPAMWTGLPVGAKAPHPQDSGAIRIGKVIGPFQQIDDTLFRLALEKSCFVAVASRHYTLTFAAVYAGDKIYKPAVQQAEMQVPVGNTEGREQRIDFSSIADQPVGVGAIKLTASSDAGLPVGYYVLEGPAEVKGDTLYLHQPPPRSRYPVKVTVVAWQYGRTMAPAIATAQPVVRTFFLNAR